MRQKMGSVNFGDVVLNHQRVADGFDIDRHGMAVVGRGTSGCKVRLRTSLILRIGKMEEPIGDIHRLNGGVNRGSHRR
jgi:hypothetical protein